MRIARSARADSLLRATPIHLAVIAMGVLWAEPSAAVQESRQRYRLPAARVDEAPVLDGMLDDVIWLRASVIDQFVQQEPDEGAPATERTEVLILYDAANLYIGVRAYDSQPGGIVSTEMRRDSERILQEDSFQIILDTFNDSRSGYMFVTSPLGAKLEQQISNEGGDSGRGGAGGGGAGNINREWDGVWHVAAGRSEDGWTAEITIPMVTLRFPAAESQEWGVNFMRNIRRKNEQVFWAPIPKAYDLARVSLAGSLTGMRSLNRGLDLRVKPFVVGGGKRTLADGTSRQGDIGLDVKYGVTAGLNIDLTLNTDFAQAEVDDERVNLTRFPLFFPEKRDFFLENAGQFGFGATASNSQLADLFFSRRIGLSDSGEHIPIIGGARLTGKIGQNSISMMDVQTEEAFGEPGQNFYVARYSRDFLARSRVGAIFINKAETGGDRFNRTYGTDLSYAPHPAMTVSGFLAQTKSPNVSGDDWGGYLNATWRDDRWRVYGEMADFQEDFNPEVGFIPRPGVQMRKIHFERNPRPGRFGIRVLEPQINFRFVEYQTGRLVTRQNHNFFGVRFENGARLALTLNRWFERLDDPDQLGNGVEVPAGAYRFKDFRVSYNSNPARRVYGAVSGASQGFFDGTRTDMGARMGLRLTDQFSAESAYSRNDIDLPVPDGAFVASVGSFRIDYAASPSMSLRTLTQYNSLTDQWSTAARFRYTYMPGSDLYIVYDEVRRDGSGFTVIQDRQLILKATYLFSR
jgi:hypothetical protein